MSDLLDAQPEDARARLHRRSRPRWIEPMLATLPHDAFSEPGFSGSTRAGKLRHPRGLGPRTDRAAADVRRERPGARR